MAVEQEFWRRDIAVEEEVVWFIIYVESDSDVSNSEDADTAPEGNESTDTCQRIEIVRVILKFEITLLAKIVMYLFFSTPKFLNFEIMK